MNAILKITDANGNSWEVNLLPSTNYSIGRGKDNDIVLDDRRASRRHAQIIAEADDFKIIDGYYEGAEIKRSVNQVFINGAPKLEKILEQDDEIIIGETKLKFNKINQGAAAIAPQDKNDSSPDSLAVPASKAVENLNYIDQPLGHTQMLISAQEIFGTRSLQSLTEIASPEEVKVLRR